jgi:pilus assembly protein Flp/PilA
VRRKLRDFLRDESAATAIEYGLIASGIGLAIITIVKGVGTNLKTTFGSISTAVK